MYDTDHLGRKRPIAPRKNRLRRAFRMTPLSRTSLPCHISALGVEIRSSTILIAAGRRWPAPSAVTLPGPAIARNSVAGCKGSLATTKSTRSSIHDRRLNLTMTALISTLFRQNGQARRARGVFRRIRPQRRLNPDRRCRLLRKKLPRGCIRRYRYRLT